MEALKVVTPILSPRINPSEFTEQMECLSTENLISGRKGGPPVYCTYYYCYCTRVSKREGREKNGREKIPEIQPREEDTESGGLI